MKVEEGESFGVEHQTSCGFDRLHIRSADGKGFGRLCSFKSAAAKRRLSINISKMYADVYEFLIF